MESERNNKVTAAQRLHMLNSTHIQRKLEQGPRIQEILTSGQKPRQIIETLYLTILSRFPTEDELKIVRDHFQAAKYNRREAAIDLGLGIDQQYGVYVSTLTRRHHRACPGGAMIDWLRRAPTAFFAFFLCGRPAGPGGRRGKTRKVRLSAVVADQSSFHRHGVGGDVDGLRHYRTNRHDQRKPSKSNFSSRGGMPNVRRHYRAGDRQPVRPRRIGGRAETQPQGQGQGGHPNLDVGRAAAHRYVRPQTGRGQRLLRSVRQADRHQRRRHPHQRIAARIWPSRPTSTRSSAA